jgi:23S rRNA (cytosine1962-C5)-methyltransferase
LTPDVTNGTKLMSGKAEKNITLKPGRERSLGWRHPWIFSGAISRRDEHLTDGDFCTVRAADGRFLARGYFCDGGSIAVKVLTFDDRPLDKDFWRTAFLSSFRLRERLGLTAGKETTAYRLIHAEGDFLPGLVVDIYNDTAVMQCQTAGMFRLRRELAAVLEELPGLGLQNIFCKSAGFRAAEETDENPGNCYLLGSEGNNTILEYGKQFRVDWERGQKTGFFLDQRENRQLLGRYSRGRTVLNAFCYTGGFSVSALCAGADFVESVDSSKSAIEGLIQNVALNQVSERHRAVTADFLRYMQTLSQDFDVIVLDPPAFVKQRNALASGMRGYKSINIQALRAIKPGGILFTFSCSQLVGEDEFRGMLFEAALESGRSLRILHRLHQAPCHPVNIFHPEGNYLKGFVVEVA